MPMTPAVDIIIVNWNSGDQLKTCLHSMQRISREGFFLDKVIVGDNGSEDGTIESIDDFDLPLKILRNPVNKGFAFACNQGAKESKADYLLFLNPDTRLFLNSLKEPIKFMEQPENSRIAICGIQLLNDEGNISRSCTRFPSLGRVLSRIIGLDRALPKFFPGHYIKEWDHKQSRCVDQVMGAFFLVRRKIYGLLNGFDERFFVYYEEVDFSYRASLLGWRSYYLADAQVYHNGGGASEQEKATRLFYSLRSRILYSFKHFKRREAIAVMLGTLIVEPVTRIVLALSRFSLKGVEETIKGYFKLWKSVPAILRAAQN